MLRPLNALIPLLICASTLLLLESGCQKKKPDQPALPPSSPEAARNTGTFPGGITGERKEASSDPSPSVISRAEAPAKAKAQPPSEPSTQAPTAKRDKTPETPGIENPAPCLELRFAHPALPGHADAEDCEQHRNAIRLPAPEHGAILKASLCVKVDRKPVKFEFDPQSREVRFGASATPESQVSIRYCTAPSRCQDPCIAEKDRFLEAIAGEGNTEDATTGNTAGSDSPLPGDVKMSAALAAEVASDSDLALFRGWKASIPSPEKLPASRCRALAGRNR
jgi:hypothetical protein